MLADHIQVSDLHDGLIELNKPMKFQQETVFAVLGRKSGICLYYRPTSEDPEMEKTLPPAIIKGAKQAKAIAEIIGVTSAKQEYKLDYSEYIEQYDNEDGTYYVICQRFSKTHSLLPSEFEALYIRPFEPFSIPYKITWETMKEF